MNFTLKDYHQNISDEELLADVKRVAGQLKQNYVTVIQQDILGKFNSSTLKRRFGTWLKAIEKTGLRITKKQANNKIPEENLLNNLEEVWVKLGRQPRLSEMIPPISKYSGYAYKRRYGAWMKALEYFVSNVNNEELIFSEKAIKSLPVKPSTKHKTQRSVNWRLRFLVMKRDNFKCKKCGRSPATDPNIILHVDHKIAWANGGETILENLETLCSICNIGKSNLE
jgi:hypothetical protein